MPTLQQLPPAIAVNPSDELLVGQAGNAVSASVAQILQALPVGHGLTLTSGNTLQADTTVLAALASPALTGTPTAPTPATGDNSAKIATTAFVLASVQSGSGTGSGSAGGSTLDPTTITLIGDVSGSGTSTIDVTLDTITTAGIFDKVTVNAKGQVTGGGTLAATDITAALGYVPYDGTTNPAGFLTTNETITLAGDASGFGTTAITLTLAPVGTAGTYEKVTTDSKGRVIAGSALAGSDITAALGYAPYDGATNPEGFLLANQAITLSGDVAGSGSTAITATLATVTSPGTYERVTVDAKGRVLAGRALDAGDVTTALGYTPAQSGETITLTGDITGSGTSTIVTTLPAIVTPGTYEKVSVNAKGQVVGGASLTTADIEAVLGYTPANEAALGTIAGQNANAVAISGGSIAGANVSGAEVTANESTTPRTLGTRAADRINVLDFGADPTGVADSTSAFAAAMAAIPSGDWGAVVVPRGTYEISAAVNQPSGRSVAVLFDDGANIVGTGFLGVDRVETKQGPYRELINSGGFFGFAPSVGAAFNPGFSSEYLFNTPQNSLSMRVGWDWRYTNTNLYGKYHSGIDIAEQKIHSWPNMYDNSSGWALWEVVNSTTIDEDIIARAGISTSAELSEIDVVNNTPEAGWTWRSGQGNTVQGMSIDPWGQNGLYGGHLLFAYGTVGSYDGNAGGLNQRWASYPAVFSVGNPGAVPQNSTLTITMDLTAKGAAGLSGSGVANVSISNGGGAYTSAPTVVFNGGGGSGAAGTAKMLGGSVVSVTITNPGSGYSSAPSVSFFGGGVATPVPVTVTLNPDGAHGDLGSIAAAIKAAGIPNLGASVAVWGGVVSRLVIFGTNASDLGTLTLSGSALGPLGLNGGSASTPRGSYSMVLGNSGNVAVGDELTINGTTVTVGGAGATSDIVNAINGANLPGVHADANANGQLVITAFIPQNPGGLVLANPPGFSTLSKVGIGSGVFWPPVPPKAFATAYGDLTSPVCLTTDAIAISATDIAGNSYGPISVVLNGGDGSGWPAAVAASCIAALQAAGIYSSDFTALSIAPALVAVRSVGSGGNQGVYFRNTAGGTLTLTDAHGTPLETLGIFPGTYKPGGYSAGSQSVFMAAEDAIAPGGRGVFVGGASNATDITVWPKTPLEARGNFQTGLRFENATFNDNAAVVLAPYHGIAWGTIAQGQYKLSVSNGTLELNGAPVAMAAGIPASSLANVLAATGVTGVAQTLALGSNLSIVNGNTLTATGEGSVTLAGDVTGSGSGTITVTLDSIGTPGTYDKVTIDAKGRVTAGSILGATDITTALGYTPLGSAAIPAGSAGAILAATGTAGLAETLVLGSNLSITGSTLNATGSGSGGVTSVVAGAGLAGGTISTTGTISLAPIAADALLGNPATAAAVPSAIAVGSGLSLSSAGTLSLANTLAGETLSAPAITGAATNAGTLSGGTLSPATMIVGTSTVDITITNTTDSGGDPLIINTVGGSSTAQIGYRLAIKDGYVQFADIGQTLPNAAGAEAIDLQLDRGAATQAATGNRAFALGAQNTVSGTRAGAIGYHNIASGQGSLALGQSSDDNGANATIVFAGGNTGQGVVNQQLSGIASSGGAVRLTSDGNTAGSANILNIPNNSVAGGQLIVVARNPNDGTAALWDVNMLYWAASNAITVSNPGTVAISPSSSSVSLAPATITITADSTNMGVNVTYQSPSGVSSHVSASFIGQQQT